MNTKFFIVYMLECGDHTFYIGSTSDVTKRLHQHNHTTAGAKYTRARRPVRVVYQEQCATYALARSREAALKRLTRAQKTLLCIPQNVNSK
ncbi:GIY-YIG nuclease family protein [Candidatus Woesebacteria bacterium]|nr:GIY-YIG nuclease family protein [Candidatus Woesebacteria bacterium]